MTKFSFTSSLLIAFTVAMVSPCEAAPLAAGEMTYSHDTKGNQIEYRGTGKREHYDVAVKVDAASLKGASLNTMYLPLSGVDKITDLIVWVSTSLPETEDSADVFSASADAQALFDAETGELRYVFENPYTVSGEGELYVGVSFGIAGLNVRSKAPLGVVAGDSDETFIRTKSLKGWTDTGANGGFTSAMRLVVSGMPAAAAGVAPLGAVRGVAGRETQLHATFLNRGFEGMSSLRYKGTVGETPFEGTLDLASNPVKPGFDYPAEAYIMLPAVAETGVYPLTIEVTEVNGKANGAAEPAAMTDARIYNTLPVKRPLVEEYTGMTCGWCPRGLVALETMGERHGDDFIALSYHCQDALQYYSNLPIGNELLLPACQIDRKADTDAYYGDGREAMGIEDVWKRHSLEFAPADIALRTSRVDENAHIEATVTFVEEITNADFHVEFFITGDGVKGEGWRQKNYYSGEESYRGQVGIEEYVDLPGNISDPVYDDVVLWWTEMNVPEQLCISGYISEDSHTDITGDVLLPDGASYAETLNVVALLVDNSDKSVVNAVKVPLGGETNAIDEVEAAEVLSTEYYDLAGRRLTSPAGICIRRSVLSDGTVITEKMVKYNY